jgi:hypothetical protein
VRRLLTVSALCATLLLAGAAHAEGSPAAEQFFRDGRAAFKRGEWEKARAMFAESQRLDPAPGTLVNLALAEEKLGKLASAWDHARGAQEGLPATDDRASVAKKLYEDLEARLPRLTLRSDKPLPDGTKIAIDDTELSTATLGVALPEDPGPHKIVIRAPGHKDMQMSVTLAEKQRETYTVQLGEISATPVTDAVPVDRSQGDRDRADRDARDRDKRDGDRRDAGGTQETSPLRTLGWVLAGTGGAGLIVGGVFGALTIDKKNTVDQHCTPGCDNPGLDASRDGKTFATVSTISFVAGGALLVGGVVLVLVAPKPERMTSTGVRADGRTISLGVRADGRTISLGGTF